MNPYMTVGLAFVVGIGIGGSPSKAFTRRRSCLSTLSLKSMSQIRTPSCESMPRGSNL
jgi:hypothetical protein